MYELKVTATKVLGRCTADPTVKPGDCFTVRDGDIRVPDGGFICIWALQNMLSVITTKEREIAEEKGINISTASRAVGRLEKRKLVSRKKDPEDRRSILVSLEPEGERIVKASEDHSYTKFKKNIEGLRQ